MTGCSAPAPIVDTHTHLDEPAFDADRELVIEASRAAGLRYFINIGYSPPRWESSRALRERHSDIDFALGLHPQLAAQFDDRLCHNLEAAIRELCPIAVGEIGFDFAKAWPGFEDQRRAFRAQLSIAADAGLPVIVHQRKASDALIAELDRWPDLAPIVLHSFDGTESLAAWARDRDCFIGIGGLAIRKSSEPLRGLLSTVPADRLLLETDSPYLAPPAAPSRRNSPANLPEIASTLGPLWGLDGVELCRRTSENAARVFDVPRLMNSS